MATFEAQAAVATVGRDYSPSSPGTNAGDNLAMSFKLSGAVDAMRQFDANGNVFMRPGDEVAVNRLTGATALHVSLSDTSLALSKNSMLDYFLRIDFSPQESAARNSS